MFEQLSAPFPPEKISWRVGSITNDKKRGMALAYIDSRDLVDRLDAVCGPENWSSDCFDAGDGRLAAKIGIWINERWVWKCDGAGGREAHKGLSENDANKGDFSDALKRAGVQWGIGRYLYDVDAPWVELDQYKKIKDGQEAKLARALSNATPATTPVAPTLQERMIAKREVGKRFDSPADSAKVRKAMLGAMGLANTQSELKHFGEVNKREIEHLIDGDWAELMIAFKKRMNEIPEGVPMEDAA